ncbi:hypothetical protein SK128_020965, partial [Halocaridina rubra]
MCFGFQVYDRPDSASLNTYHYRRFQLGTSAELSVYTSRLDSLSAYILNLNIIIQPMRSRSAQFGSGPKFGSLKR